ncbi:2285_t:CDS:2 [Funneliformis geosporum]|uniref:2285_t:CDS:1 n=1 Tax=Funneliformis geosporum TaxID=1117311 RepID=A0A9W4WTD3_9GLOM|nr:2285_t:CDS:2 [Funneliformis geosporum]
MWDFYKKSSPALEVPNRLTSKSEIQLQGETSQKEVQKSSCISGEKGQHQELLFRNINLWQAGRNERRDEINVFQCPNREKIEGLQKLLGLVFRVVSSSNRFDSFGNNLSLVVDMIVNESDRFRIATSLDIEIQSNDLRKDDIRYYIMEIALCGFNHIIVIGKCYCNLLFLNCYECVFRWDSMTDVLLLIRNFKAVSEKPREVCEVV